jgi:hypothetical protein
MMNKKIFIALAICAVFAAAGYAKPDVYVIGNEYVDDEPRACYWKNSQKTVLADSGGANLIYVTRWWRW